MSEKKGFDLASVLSDVSIPGTGREQIEYIEIFKLISDGNNFYSMDGVEELAENIELVGLQQPLRVRPDGIDYVVVSGHRRLAALRILVKDGRSDLADVPCIVERGEVSPAMRELRLIYANSDTRKMSSADVSKQAERVEALLYQLKEEGYEFPGRMRDHVAEACKVSKSKLARLKVIRKKLIPFFLDAWEAGDLAETTAYAIAQGDGEAQAALKEYMLKNGNVKNLAEWQVTGFYGDLRRLKQRHCPDGEKLCGSVDSFLQKYSKEPYCICVNTCCARCWKLVSCPDSCPEAGAEKAKRLAEKAEREAEKAALLEQEEINKAAEKLEWRKQWLRLGEAMEKADVSTEMLLEELGFVEADEKYDFDSYLSGEAADVEDCALDPEYDGIEKYVNVADLLHVSVDYLLGRGSLDPAGVPYWRTGEPPADGIYWASFDLDGHSFSQKAYYRADLKQWGFTSGVRIEAECRAWYPLPPDRDG